MQQRTIVVVDDQASFRRALRAVAAAAACVVVGEADSAETAFELLGEIDRPDLVLVDINLGPSSGLDLTRRLVDRDPELRIMLVSTMERVDLPRDAETSGAIGFVEKSQLGPGLVNTLADEAPEDVLL